MKISVIVPVYNCEAYVQRCVMSILNQTHKELEVICVNDGSTDRSGLILEELAQKDQRIRVLQQCNKGVSAARNAGIEIASGKYITFVDADDALEPDMYECLLTLFREDIDIVHCGYKRIRLDGSIKEVNGTELKYFQTHDEALECLLRGKMFVGSLCNKIYRAHLFATVRSDPDLIINEDVLMNVQLFAQAKGSIYYDTTKYCMFERQGSATRGTAREKIYSNTAIASQKMYAMFQGTPLESDAACRMVSGLIHEYRWKICSGIEMSVDERLQLRDRIKKLLPACRLSCRMKANWIFMDTFPRLYKNVYIIYDKIRTPNWDV